MPKSPLARQRTPSPKARNTEALSALLAWRRTHALTQEEAAPLLMIGVRSLQNYEQGHRPVPKYVVAFTKLPIKTLRAL